MIRINPFQVKQQAGQIDKISAELQKINKDILQAAESAPSYDGQFGPKVRAIGQMLYASGTQRSTDLNVRSNDLAKRADKFDKTDKKQIFKKTIFEFFSSIIPRKDKVYQTISSLLSETGKTINQYIRDFDPKQILASTQDFNRNSSQTRDFQEEVNKRNQKKKESDSKKGDSKVIKFPKIPLWKSDQKEVRDTSTGKKVSKKKTDKDSSKSLLDKILDFEITIFHFDAGDFHLYKDKEPNVDTKYESGWVMYNEEDQHTQHADEEILVREAYTTSFLNVSGGTDVKFSFRNGFRAVSNFDFSVLETKKLVIYGDDEDHYQTVASVDAKWLGFGTEYDTDKINPFASKQDGKKTTSAKSDSDGGSFLSKFISGASIDVYVAEADCTLGENYGDTYVGVEGTVRLGMKVGYDVDENTTTVDTGPFSMGATVGERVEIDS